MRFEQCLIAASVVVLGGAAVLPGLLAPGCGPTSPSPGTDAGTTALLRPPAPGPAHAGDGSGSATFAVQRWYLGDTLRDGTRDLANGWQHFGYDLDGVNTTNATPDTSLCRRSANASPRLVLDGGGGVDNSFGHNILPLLMGLRPNPSTDANASLAQGRGTILLSLQRLGSGRTYLPIDTRLYLAADLGHMPLFDGSDRWPVGVQNLTDPTNIDTARIDFPAAYVTDNTWVSGTGLDFQLTLYLGPMTLRLTLVHAVITADLDATHHVAHGTIAGILPADQFITDLSFAIASNDPTLCNGPTLQSVVQEASLAADILQDGSQNPAAQCNGISVGIGFDASTVVLGDIVPAQAPPPPPCSGDAGVRD